MRTFIAIDIPPTKELQALQYDISANLEGVDIKYADANHHHITLSFLGETSAIQVQAICDSLKMIKLPSALINVVLRGIGLFNNEQKPSILWVGIEPNLALENLWFEINKIIAAHGLPTNQRRFSPHLTLGRIKRTKTIHNIEVFRQKYQHVMFGSIQVKEFVFYQSILSPQGSVYNPIQKFTLNLF